MEFEDVIRDSFGNTSVGRGRGVPQTNGSETLWATFSGTRGCRPQTRTCLASVTASWPPARSGFSRTSSAAVGSSGPGCTALLDFARRGDALCVVRLDHLGRSLRELLATVDQLKVREIALMSQEEKIDTTSAAGELMFHAFGAKRP